MDIMAAARRALEERMIEAWNLLAKPSLNGFNADWLTTFSCQELLLSEYVFG